MGLTAFNRARREADADNEVVLDAADLADGVLDDAGADADTGAKKPKPKPKAAAE